jgi:hypothetical protein
VSSKKNDIVVKLWAAATILPELLISNADFPRGRAVTQSREVNVKLPQI